MIKKLLLLVLIAVSLTALPGRAQAPHRAGLIVQFADGQVETACVTFAEESLSGVDLLLRANLSATFDYSSGLGAKVCQIGDTGCDYPAQDCWCQCQGSPCAYWNYWQVRNGQWLYSSLGAGSRRLNDGDIDGWAWGDGQQPPPLLSLDQICQAGDRTTEVTQLDFTSPLATPTATGPDSPLLPPSPDTPAFQPTTQIYVPPPARETPSLDLPPSSDRYVGLAGLLAALGFIVLTLWRRRTGV